MLLHKLPNEQIPGPLIDKLFWRIIQRYPPPFFKVLWLRQFRLLIRLTFEEVEGIARVSSGHRSEETFDLKICNTHLLLHLPSESLPQRLALAPSSSWDGPEGFGFIHS